MVKTIKYKVILLEKKFKFANYCLPESVKQLEFWKEQLLLITCKLPWVTPPESKFGGVIFTRKKALEFVQAGSRLLCEESSSIETLTWSIHIVSVLRWDELCRLYDKGDSKWLMYI